MKLVDLSHPLVHGMITYPGLPAPALSDHLDRESSRAHYDAPTEFHIGRIDMVTNTGTYVDVPFHRYESGADLERFPLGRLVDLHGIVVDARDQDGRSLELEATEALRGKAVLFRTGWSRHWGTETYVSGDYPFIGEQLASDLIDVGVVLVGIDSLNVDDNSGRTRPAHSMFLAAQIPIVEHLTSLDQLPESGFRFFAPPPAVRGAGSFPVRAFALIGS